MGGAQKDSTFISFFSPNLRTMIELMEANRQARLLVKMRAPENEYDRLTNKLYTMTRKAGTSLNVVLAQLSELATARAAEMSIENVNEEYLSRVEIGRAHV